MGYGVQSAEFPMSAFDRLKNVAKGKVSKAVGDLERANPEAVYEAAIANAKARIEERDRRSQSSRWTRLFPVAF